MPSRLTAAIASSARSRAKRAGAAVSRQQVAGCPAPAAAAAPAHPPAAAASGSPAAGSWQQAGTAAGDTRTGEGRPVAHGHVAVRVNALALQAGAQRLRLLLRDAAQRGAAADGLVALARLGRAHRGDELRDGGLQELHGGRQPDDVRVRKQVVQKGLHVVQRVGAAQIEQQHADALLRGRGRRRKRGAACRRVGAAAAGQRAAAAAALPLKEGRRGGGLQAGCPPAAAAALL